MNIVINGYLAYKRQTATDNRHRLKTKTERIVY